MAILILNNETLINQNISDISTNTYDIILHDTRLDSVELKTRHQSSAYNTTFFDYTVQAVDCFGYNPIQGNCSVIRNKILITDIQAVNNIQTTDISNIKIVNNTQTNDISNIQAVNNTQTTDISNIQIVNTTQTNDINTLKQKTMFQTSNGTSETRFNSHVHGVNFYSWDNRYNNGSTSIISNYQEILSLQAINATQSADIVAIQAVNTTQDGRLTYIETKTDKLTISGSILDVNNTCSSLRLNQDLNMNNNNIDNTQRTTYTGYGGSAQLYCSSSSMFNIDSTLLGDTTNGSGFNFKCVKGGLTKNLSLNYNDLNLNNRTISNCSSINTITSNISGHNSEISELFSRKPGFAKCRVVRNSSDYSLAWFFGFVPVSVAPFNVYVESASPAIIQLIVFADVTATRGCINDQFVVTTSGLDGTNPAANRVMRGICVSKTYVTNGLLPGYQIKILLSRGDDIAGSRDLSVGVSSFLDIIVTW
jgi:hypothetical protein